MPQIQTMADQLLLSSMDDLLECTNPNCIYTFFYMGVSENGGTPKSSNLIGISIVNHPFWGTPIFGNIHIFHYMFMRSNYTFHDIGHVSPNSQISRSLERHVAWMNPLRV